MLPVWWAGKFLQPKVIYIIVPPSELNRVDDQPHHQFGKRWLDSWRSFSSPLRCWSGWVTKNFIYLELYISIQAPRMAPCMTYKSLGSCPVKMGLPDERTGCKILMTYLLVFGTYLQNRAWVWIESFQPTWLWGVQSWSRTRMVNILIEETGPC